MDRFATIFLALLAVGGVSTRGYSAEILSTLLERDLVAVSVDSDSSWSIEDYVCLIHQWKRVGCGDIVKLGSKGVIILLAAHTGTLKKGDQVDMLKVDIVTRGRDLTLGMSYFFPHGHIQQLVSPNWAYGIMPMVIYFVSGTQSLKGFSLYGTINYYSFPFKGLWLRGGFGLHILNTLNGTNESLRVSATHVTMLATAGWRFLWPSGFNIGIAGGAQYFFDPNVVAVTGNAGFLPSIVAEVGMTF